MASNAVGKTNKMNIPRKFELKLKPFFTTLVKLFYRMHDKTNNYDTAVNITCVFLALKFKMLNLQSTNQRY